MRLGQFLFTILIALVLFALIGIVDWSTVGDWALIMLVLALMGPVLLIISYLVLKVKDNSEVISRRLGVFFNWVIIISGFVIFILIVLSQSNTKNPYRESQHSTSQQKIDSNPKTSISEEAIDLEKPAEPKPKTQDYNLNVDNNLNINVKEYLKEKLQKKESWANKEYFETYILSHEAIISEIFYLDLSNPEDMKEYYEIVSNDDKYILTESFKDLNNDGRKDLLIENHTSGYTGSGGYSTYIFIYESGKYKFLQKFFGGYVEVLETSSNNYKELNFSHKKYLDEGGYKYVEDLMTWNGNEYSN
jgi:hypothetical protein